MKPIVKISVTGNMMEVWYKSREPDGTSYDWDHFFQAREFYECNGYEMVWEYNGNPNSERFKPDYFKNQQVSLDF